MVNASRVEVDAVVFDIGGVLIEVDFARTQAAISRLVTLPPAEIARRLISHPVFIEFECGRVGVDAFRREVEGVLGCALSPETFHAAWNGIFKSEINENIEILKTLRRRSNFKVGVLSNTNLPHFEYLKKNMLVLNDVEHLYASHEIGCRKPEPESYQHVLKRMNVAPERAVFIDDLSENLEGARRVGMKTIHATNPAAVKAGLSELGLL